jgi:tRNA(Ile)-lysidine synthase
MQIGSAHGDRPDPKALVAPGASGALTPSIQDEFASAMNLVGPFEPSPHVAVAVSGGPDSMALLRLMADWAAKRNGRVSALTVDHGLRPESAAEADTVASWALALGIDHRILPWQGAKPVTGVQAAARKARYDLLLDWCNGAYIRHLALAHHFEDQQETVAMRGAHGSTAFGLAGMTGVAVKAGIRIIRPLLATSKTRLQAYLSDLGQPFLDDPSNLMQRFERVRWRTGLLGPLPGRDEILAAGRARARLDNAARDWLLRSVTLHEAGYALLSPLSLAGAAEPVLLRGLGQILLTVGGGEYAPAEKNLRRLVLHLQDGGPMRALGGCLSGRWRTQILICREAASAREALEFAPGTERKTAQWDRRFRVEIAPSAEKRRIACVGQAGLADLAQWHKKDLDYGFIPAPARASLPALLGPPGPTLPEAGGDGIEGVTPPQERVLCVPHLGFGSGLKAWFDPMLSLENCGFVVV